MPSPLKRPGAQLKRQLINLCKDIAGSYKITSACIIGDYALGFTDAKKVIELLLVIRNFHPRLASHVKTLNSRKVIILAVDEQVFEKDVDRGLLGEALAEGIIFPYIPLTSKDYLHLQEVKLKRRLILELLENLVLDFPELSYIFHIKPEYFMYETVMSRARLFPPMIYGVLNFLQNIDVKDRNVQSAMQGYLKALKRLEKENTVTFSDGHVRICKAFVEKVKTKKIRFVNLFRTAQRALFASLLGTFSQTLGFLSQNMGRLRRFQRVVQENAGFVHRLGDPLKYLHVPTARGLVPLSDKMDIEAFAREVLSQGGKAEIKIEEIGGVLNDVYLVSAFVNDGEKKIVVKRFKNWSSFKWFPLNIWTLGTRTFTVLARSRLERECAINQLLHSKGFDVPKILHVTHVKRLVFREYVEGVKLNKILEKIWKSKTNEDLENSLNIVGRVGERFAEVHALGIALGDTKPENIIIRGNGEICLLDLEQAARRGDQVWDIAEFLYYAAHYIPPLVGTRPADLMTKAFIEGYLRGGGNINLVKKVGNPKYTKVFSIFAFPHIILAISNLCKESGKLKK